jgi:hypothetical protein
LTIAGRIATVSLGLVALAWGCFVVPLVWNQTMTAQLSRKIIAGEQYAPGLLSKLADTTEKEVRADVCQPLVRHTLAVIRLRLAEEALSNGSASAIGQTQAALRSALLGAFECTPTDPFLWLAEFWLQNNERGLRDDNFQCLRMSYRFGANEGWLALRRNRYAIAIYPALPADLKKFAREEFVQLVRSDFITDAADIIVGPGRPISDMLLSHLEGIDDQKLKFLARLLDGKGFAARVPGVPGPRFHSG